MAYKETRSSYEAKDIHIISEAVDGRIVETRLPKDKAHKLHKKLIDTGTDVSIKKESEFDNFFDEFIEKVAINFEVPVNMLRADKESQEE